MITETLPIKREAGIQIIRCKCGAIRAACWEPMCYTDAEWMKDMRKMVKKGYTVEVVQEFRFGKCTCGMPLFT